VSAGCHLGGDYFLYISGDIQISIDAPDPGGHWSPLIPAYCARMNAGVCEETVPEVPPKYFEDAATQTVKADYWSSDAILEYIPDHTDSTHRSYTLQSERVSGANLHFLSESNVYGNVSFCTLGLALNYLLPGSGGDENLGSPEDNEDTEYDDGSNSNGGGGNGGNGGGNSCGSGGAGPGSNSINGLPKYRVNTSTLNLVVQDTDFSYKGIGPAVAFTRTWNASPTTIGMFGRGWNFPYESRIKLSGSSGGILSLIKGSGQKIAYRSSSQSTDANGVTTSVYTLVNTDSGNHDTLTGMFNTSTSSFIFTDKKSKYSYLYEYEGVISGTTNYRLNSITDKNNNTLTVHYNTDGTIHDVTDAAGRTTTFGYNSGDTKCASMTTPDGKTAHYSYDVNGNLIQSIDLLGTLVSYTYEPNNYMTSLNVGTKTTLFDYDQSGGWIHISKITDAEGNVRTYMATFAGNTTITDARGNKTSYSSFGGKTTSVTDPLGNTTTTGYTNGLPVSITAPRGGITLREYDTRGNMTKLTDAIGNITRFTYDGNDNMLTLQNALLNTWHYDYDAAGNLTRETSPLGKQTNFEYFTNGTLKKATDPNSHITSFTYDANGNLATKTNAFGTITYVYDPYGIKRTSVTDPNLNLTRYSYDDNQRLTSVTHPDGSQRFITYDACASTSRTDENANTTEYTRNKLLKITETKDPLFKVTTSSYDTNGNLISIQDPLLHLVTNTYDAANRLASTLDPLGSSIGFSRDKTGNITTVTDERAKQTTLAYTPLNTLFSIKDALQKEVTNTFDPLGRASLTTNARGSTIGYTYNEDGQLIDKNYGATIPATYAYNGAGLLASATDETGTYGYQYDAANRLTTLTYPDLSTTGFAYDPAGNLTGINYPGGQTVSYTFNNRNRIISMNWVSNSNQYTISYTYDNVGNLLTETRSNGTSSNYIYDKNNRYSTIRHLKDATTFASMDYTRDDAGMIITETRTLPAPEPTLPDSSGNGTYNDVNQIVNWGGTGFVYDADGNLMAGANFSAVYDTRNRPIGITQDGTTTAHSYDSFGNRVRSVRTPQTRNYHYDPAGRLLYETDAGNAVTVRYFYRGRSLIAMQTADGSVYFYHSDKTGSTVALTDNTGTITNAYIYDPYGKVLSSSGTLANSFTYVGAYGVMDEGNGIYYMKNRYYDATTGRFLQKDPIGFAGGQTNLYAYVGGNPVDRIDPKGKKGSNSNATANYCQAPDVAAGTANVGFDPSNPLDTREAADRRTLNMLDMAFHIYTAIPGAPRNSEMSAVEALVKGDYSTFVYQSGKAVLFSGWTGFAVDVLEKVLPAPPVDENGNVITPKEYFVPFDLGN
jgi:RHS repeat-associated protein